MTGTPTRLLTLLSLLQARRDWSGPALADRLAVTTRTVRRDVDRLRDLGYTITAVKGPDGGYRLGAGSQVPPLLFDDEQTVALAIALQHTRSAGIDLDEASARALRTVRQVLPPHLRHRLDQIRFTDAGPAPRVQPDILEAVSTAVQAHRTLTFDYGDDTTRPPRRVEPHAVAARQGRWYLIAWDLGADDWRVFRLDRLTPKFAGGHAFPPRELPGGGAEEFLAARFRGSDSGSAWPCVGEVLIDLPAERVAPFLEDGVLEVVSEGRCRVRVGSWSWAGVVSWVLRFDAGFEVVGPEGLVAAAREAADRLGAAVPAESAVPAGRAAPARPVAG
ncbi:helix-turn-helix transcriptional regulator [Cellulomonas taurus]|uniref:helix-turn-helix transcriptional regulator n=1 Tax=Cellulomonas taurus TaxID=2729175 RepID=UPI001FEA39B1|nr:WYL domain-containing protein [Cellulomonas taurus]